MASLTAAHSAWVGVCQRTERRPLIVHHGETARSNLRHLLRRFLNGIVEFQADGFPIRALSDLHGSCLLISTAGILSSPHPRLSFPQNPIPRWSRSRIAIPVTMSMAVTIPARPPAICVLRNILRPPFLPSSDIDIGRFRGAGHTGYLVRAQRRGAIQAVQVKRSSKARPKVYKKYQDCDATGTRERGACSPDSHDWARCHPRSS